MFFDVTGVILYGYPGWSLVMADSDTGVLPQFKSHLLATPKSQLFAMLKSRTPLRNDSSSDGSFNSSHLLQSCATAGDSAFVGSTLDLRDKKRNQDVYNNNNNNVVDGDSLIQVCVNTWNDSTFDILLTHSGDWPSWNKVSSKNIVSPSINVHSHSQHRMFELVSLCKTHFSPCRSRIWQSQTCGQESAAVDQCWTDANNGSYQFLCKSYCTEVTWMSWAEVRWVESSLSITNCDVYCNIAVIWSHG